LIEELLLLNKTSIAVEVRLKLKFLDSLKVELSLLRLKVPTTNG